MNEGMLWLDDSNNRSIEDKVSRAVVWYKEHYGPKPNICFVHPSSVQEEQLIDGVSVKPASFIQPNHFWIGSGSPPSA